MKVSFLIASRGRPKEFAVAVSSIFDRAVDPDNVEVIARLDVCDPAIHDYIPIIQTFRNVRDILGQRGRGYIDNGLYFNEAAIVANGQYLIQFVDDAIIETSAWDKAFFDTVGDKQDFIGTFKVRTPDGSNYRFSVPVLPRRIYDICGMYALDNHTSVDRCWDGVARATGLELKIPVDVYHAHIGAPNCEIDRTAREGRVPWCHNLSMNSGEYDKIEKIGKKYSAKIMEALSGHDTLKR